MVRVVSAYLFGLSISVGEFLLGYRLQEALFPIVPFGRQPAHAFVFLVSGDPGLQITRVPIVFLVIASHVLSGSLVRGGRVGLTILNKSFVRGDLEFVV